MLEKEINFLNTLSKKIAPQVHMEFLEWEFLIRGCGVVFVCEEYEYNLWYTTSEEGQSNLEFFPRGPRDLDLTKSEIKNLESIVRKYTS